MICRGGVRSAVSRPFMLSREWMMGILWCFVLGCMCRSTRQVILSFTCFTSTKVRTQGLVWCFVSGCMCRSKRQVILSLLALLVQKVHILAPVRGVGLYVQAYSV